MRIIIVRHGESESNAGLTKSHNSNLTKKGRLQAKHAGNGLKKQNISEIYTSDLLRARQTGEIISKIIKVPIKGNFEELNEYHNRNVKFGLIRLFSPRAMRLRKFLRKISKEREDNKTILIVAYANSNRIILSYLLQIHSRKQFFRLRQHNTAVNVLAWNKEYKNWALFHMNDIRHLPKKLIDKEHETNILR